MKELSIEEKAKRYDEAIERARTEYKNHEEFKGFCKMLVNIFPELAESEDERVWRELIEGFKRYDDGALFNGCLVRDILAWLEKQGEHKPVIEMKSAEESLGIDSDTYTKIVDECIFGEQKPAWSDEDETSLGDALWCCKQAASIAKDENDMGNVWYVEHWLKSLKERYTWEPSDEQMNALREAVIEMGKSVSRCSIEEFHEIESLYNDLKKLKQ